MTSLAIQQGREGETLRLVLKGQIDEDSDYAAVRVDGAKRVVFDFDGVKLINSTGIQRWIKFLQGMPAKAEIVFTRCAIKVITQINLFPGFLGGRAVAIESFYAPYFCEACDSSCDILIETAADIQTPKAAKAPKKLCPRCNGAAEFDGIEKKYFLFLAS